MIRTRLFVASLLAFLSGTAALAYETLWNRVLTNLIGATNFSATLVLVIFFSCLSLGSASLRHWSLIARSPWLAFSFLEAGIALSILPTVFLSFFDVYPSAGIRSPEWRVAVQIIVAVFLIGVPSFFMGGTLLALINATTGTSKQGRVSLIYGINTVGGAVGIAAATFWLVYGIGTRASLFTFMGVSFGISFISLFCHQRWTFSTATFKKREHTLSTLEPESANPRWLLALAAASGATVICFEILFLHTFALVAQNSAWAFGAMLMLVITALGTAAVLISMMPFAPMTLLKLILPFVSLGLFLFPNIFFLHTEGLQDISLRSGSFGSHVLDLLWVGALTSGPVLLLVGFVFPSILDAASRRPGGDLHKNIGLLLALNAFGAIVGAVTIQWVLIPHLGIWKSYILLGTVPLVMWLMVVWKMPFLNKRIRWAARACALILIILMIYLFPQELPYSPSFRNQKIIEVRTGPEGVVHIRKKHGNLWLISTNNRFSTSISKEKLALNQRMSHIPLLLHPDPEQVAYIGMGTGATVSGAARHTKVKSIILLELSPLVIELSFKHFLQFIGHLKNDSRLTILEADGVHHFATTDNAYDVVIGEVFFPYREGAARLYSREHFTHVRRHLTPGGIFCQWLPLFQFDQTTLSLVARTFQSVFPNAVLIRQLRGPHEFVALLGNKSNRPIEGEKIKMIWTQRQREENLEDPFLKYSSCLDRILIGRIKDMFPKNVSLNTLDRPILEPKAIRLASTLFQKGFRVEDIFRKNGAGP
ncbi:spermidine synthase [Thermodesulfobacteriota bacterium]